MKKLLTLGLVAMLAFGMTACGGSSEPAATDEAATEAAADAGSDTAADTEESADVSTEESALTHGYMGTIGDDGTTVFMAMDDDITIASFVALSPDGKQNVNFIGEAEVSDAGDITIHDTTDGVDFTFSATDNGDDTYTLDMGDLGTAKVAECDVKEVLDAYDTIDAATEKVTVA